MKSVRELVYKRNRKAVEQAYQEFIDGADEAESKLFQIVLDFAKGKVSSALFDSPESTLTADDHAQEVVIRVWEKLGEFIGDAPNFYSWLNRVCYVEGAHAINSVTEEFGRREPLFIESEDDPGVFEDNPLLTQSEQYIEHRVELPEFIQGIDLQICTLIRSGYSYKNIGILLEISEKAVELRIKRMREKAIAWKAKQNPRDTQGFVSNRTD